MTLNEYIVDPAASAAYAALHADAVMAVDGEPLELLEVAVGPEYHVGRGLLGADELVALRLLLILGDGIADALTGPHVDYIGHLPMDLLDGVLLLLLLGQSAPLLVLTL